MRNIIIAITILSLLLSCTVNNSNKVNSSYFEKSFKEEKGEGFIEHLDSTTNISSNFRYNIAFDAPDNWKIDAGVSEHTIFRTFQPDSSMTFSINVIEQKLNESEKIDIWELYQKYKEQFDNQFRTTLETQLNSKMENLVSVSSFNPLTLRNFNKISHHKIETADIYARTKGVPKILQTGNGRFISHSTYLKPRYDMIDSLYMKKYGKRKKIVAWTVNSAQTAQRMSNLGVYAVISNNPSYIKGVLDGPTVL